MGTLAMAYMAASFAVGLYVSWLGIRSRRLAQRLDALESIVKTTDNNSPRSKAA